MQVNDDCIQVTGSICLICAESVIKNDVLMSRWQGFSYGLARAMQIHTNMLSSFVRHVTRGPLILFVPILILVYSYMARRLSVSVFIYSISTRGFYTLDRSIQHWRSQFSQSGAIWTEWIIVLLQVNHPFFLVEIGVSRSRETGKIMC